ncbi:unnamed protein product [Rotaria sordida]|uniref:PiggyBac transposable element-derived protein domain-containing protein n=1 Tax=Rotaria sordida TaxID=392033 RepID=A0A814XQ95_9BILA|nr:unnamed protein product [Rotaria sordida]CAF1218099.1 unnamed protein product [Rotaria sordida]
MDSESGNESGDYSYDESSDEVEYSSDWDEEYTASFEKISTTRRNLRKGNFNPRLFSFDSSSCELSFTIKNLALETPFDFFKLFFDRRLLETIVKETNRFHANSAWTSYSRTAPWIDTTINEMYTFLATVMLMPHSKKNRICDYWSTDHLIATPIFAELFTRNRFRALLTNLHFNKNQNQIVKDSLYKIQSIIDELKKRRTVSRVIDSARTAIIKHFVPKYLGFSHLTRRELIDNHTRPLAKLLFDQPGEDKAIIILDGTYIYVQKSGNNLLQRRTYSLHKDRALIKPMMFVSTDS